MDQKNLSFLLKFQEEDNGEDRNVDKTKHTAAKLLLITMKLMIFCTQHFTFSIVIRFFACHQVQTTENNKIHRT